MISWVNGQKQENLLQFNTSWLASLRIWYYFRLFSSFSCPCYDLILIKKSQINWSLTYYSHVKILFFDFTWKKFCSRKWWVGGGGGGGGPPALLRYELVEGDLASMGMHCTILELSGNSCQVIGPVRPWSRPLLTLLIWVEQGHLELPVVWKCLFCLSAKQHDWPIYQCWSYAAWSEICFSACFSDDRNVSQNNRMP